MCLSRSLDCAPNYLSCSELEFSAVNVDVEFILEMCASVFVCSSESRPFRTFLSRRSCRGPC